MIPTNQYSGINQLIDSFFNTPGESYFKVASSSTFPKFNVYGTKQEDTSVLVVEAAIAGYSIDDIDLSIDGNILVFSHSSKKEVTKEATHTYVNEIKKSSFERKILLPETLDFSDPEVTCKDGIIKVVFKEDPTKGPKRLKITEG